MALTIDPTTPCAIPVARQNPARSRVFRADEIPLAWNKQILTDRLQEHFPHYKLRVDSFYKHPSGESNRSLVTFQSSVPELLPEGDDTDGSTWVEFGDDDQIALGPCHGMTTLFEPSDGQPPQVDVVFVHGLGGHAIGSWMAANGKCWPRDFLGNDLEGARVLSFGYEAKLHKDTSTSQLSDFGRQLRGELYDFRPSPEDQERPLFLVGHSYGGTVISWVLNELSSKKDTQPTDGDMLRSIRCATFFGTPHSGMSVEPLEALTTKRQHESMIRTLGDLKPNSELLKVLHDHLRRLSANTKIRVISCVEQKLTRVPTINGGKVDNEKAKFYQAVDLSQARTYAQTEDDAIPIHADHRGMVKFDRKSDPGYRQVLRQLKQALDDCGQTSIIRTLAEDQKRSLWASLANAAPELEDRRSTIKDAHDSTCEWLLQCKEYKGLIDGPRKAKEDDPILWIKGNAGSGKSTLMKFATTHLEANNHLAISFFFSNRGPPAQKSVKSMYHALLLQVFQAAESIPSEVPVLEQWRREPNLTWQAPALTQLLEAVVPRLSRPVFCFIDALDECEAAQEVETFCRRLAQLCAKKGTIFKACVSSRHSTKTSTQQQRSLVLEEQDGHKRDILTYIEHHLRSSQSESTRRLCRSIQQKASGIFLWAVVAVKALCKELSYSHPPMLQQRLDEMPADVPGLYRHVLTRDSNDTLLHCLRLVLFSQVPPSPMSLYPIVMMLTAGSDALSMLSNSRGQRWSIEDQARDFFIDASKGLVEVAGPHASVVRFVHASVPEFLHSEEAISQVWRESPETFEGKGHHVVAGCFLSLIQNPPIPAPGAAEHAGYLEYPGWQDAEERCLERGFDRPVEHYYNQHPGQGFAADELFLPHHATGPAMQYYHADDAIDASHPSHTLPPPHHLPSPDNPLSAAIQYAVDNILYHSNSAEKAGISQAAFLQSFPLPQYVSLKDTLSASSHQPEPFAADHPSLLHILADANSPALLTTLLSSTRSTADINRKDPHTGRTPLAAAASRGHAEVVQLLLTSGAPLDLETRDADGRTPTALAALSGSAETLRALLANNSGRSRARPNLAARDADGRTPLALAAGSGCVEAVRVLLLEDATAGGGGGVGDADDDGRTPLALAAVSGSVEVVRLLLLLLLPDAAGNKPGGVAVVGIGDRVPIRDVVDARDNLGRTPLSLAAEEGYADVCGLLVGTERVDRGAKDVHGASPLDYADWRRRLLKPEERGTGLEEGLDAVVAMLRGGDAEPPRLLVEEYRVQEVRREEKKLAVTQQGQQRGAVDGGQGQHQRPKVDRLVSGHGLQQQQQQAPSYHHAPAHQHHQPYVQHSHSDRAAAQHVAHSPYETGFHHEPHIQPAADWQYDAASPSVYSPQSTLGGHEYDYGNHGDAHVGYHDYEDEEVHQGNGHHAYEGNGYGHDDGQDSGYGDEEDGLTDDGCDDDSDDDGHGVQRY